MQQLDIILSKTIPYKLLKPSWVVGAVSSILTKRHVSKLHAIKYLFSFFLGIKGNISEIVMIRIRPKKIINSVVFALIFSYLSSSYGYAIVVQTTDMRTRIVATKLTYEFLLSQDFFDCSTEWLASQLPVNCEAFRLKVIETADSFKQLKFESPADAKFIEVIELYRAARKEALPHCARWDSGHRPDICFRLIVNTIDEVWKSKQSK